MGLYRPGCVWIEVCPKKGMLSSCGKVRKGFGLSERVIFNQCSTFPCPCNSAFRLSCSSPSPSRARLPPSPHNLNLVGLRGNGSIKHCISSTIWISKERTQREQKSRLVICFPLSEQTAAPAEPLTHLCFVFVQIAPRGGSSGKRGPGCWLRGRPSRPSCPAWTLTPRLGKRRGRETREC